MKEKIRIIIIVAVIITTFATATGLIYFYVQNSSDSKDLSQSALEEYSKDKEVEWKKTTRDFTGQLSDEEIEAMKSESLSAVDGFNQVMFNFGQDTADYTETLYSLYVPEGTEGSDRNVNSTRFNDFKEMNVESSYQGFEPYSVVINDNTDVPTIVVNGLMTISYKSNNISKGDYDVCAKYVLEQRDGKWLLYSSKFSTIYVSGTVKASRLSSDENTITYTGKRVGYFQSSY